MGRVLFTALAGVASISATEAFGQSDPAAVVDEVVVTASRTETASLDVPASVASQDLEELRLRGFTYGTDEFRGVPGVFFRRGEGDGDEFAFVSIRGSSGTEGYLAMVDGVPFFGPDEEPLLAQVPYDALDRVEIVKGPVSALYGRGGLYGAVNYITRSPRDGVSSAAVSVGSDRYARGEVVLSRGGERGAGLLSMAYEDYDGWRENSSKRLFTLFGKGEFALTDRTTLEGSFTYLDRRSEVPNAVPVTPAGRVVDVVGGPENFLGFGRPLNDTEGLIGQLRLTHEVSETLSFSAVVQGRRFDQDLRLNFFDPFGVDLTRNVVAFNGFRGESEHRVVFGEAALNWRGGNHNVIAGISAERSRSRGLDSWSGQNGFTPGCGFTFYLIEVDYTTGQVVNGSHPCFVIDDPLTRDRFTDRFWGAFVQDEIALGDRWRLTLGLRYDSFERSALISSPASAPPNTLEGDASAVSPKASLSYRYGEGQVYFAYGRGFSSNFGPTFEWDAAQYARPENKPSTLDSFELGWKGLAFDGRLRFEAAAFYTIQTNRRQLIPNPDAATDPTAPGTLVTYGSEYRSRGVELSFEYMPTAETTLRAQFSWLDPQWNDYVVQTFGGPVDLSGKTPTGVAEHIVYLAGEHRFTPWLTGHASFEAYGEYAVTQNNSVVQGGYQLLSVGVRVAPPEWTGMTLDLSVNNALDEDYWFYFGGRANPTYATPGPPRQVRLTLRAVF